MITRTYAALIYVTTADRRKKCATSVSETPQ